MHKACQKPVSATIPAVRACGQVTTGCGRSSPCILYTIWNESDRGYQVPKNGSINIEFPQGVIYAYAWILEPINKTVSGGPWRPNNTVKWEIYIRENNMKMVGP